MSSRLYNKTREAYKQLTKEYLESLFIYNSETGELKNRFWRNPKAGAGQLAGTLELNGYIGVSVNRTKQLAHRLIWIMMTDDIVPDDMEVDHINGIKSDNRWCNLRLATHSQNNSYRLACSNNKSGFKGVYWNERDKMWRAQMSINGATTYLGQSRNKEEAAKIYENAAKNLQGEFAKTGLRK